MRLPILSAFVAISLLTVPPTVAWAADAEHEDAATSTTIHLMERAERQIPRDRLVATLRAEAEGLDPAKVQDAINRRMQDALALAKTVTPVKVESGSYSVYRRSPPAANSTTPDKWAASQTMILESRDFAPALALIGKLQGAGLVIQDLNFDVAPETLRAAEDAMTAEALTALRARAERVAAAMGMTVDRYRSIEIGNVTTQEFRRPMPLRMASAAKSETAPVAEAGESTAFLTVDAQVILEAKKAP